MSKIFISYRREDSQDIVGRLNDRLEKYYNKDDIFIDVDSILHGENFKSKINEAIKKSEVLLLIIGKRWVEKLDENIERKLADYVLLEIELALSNNVTIIPVLTSSSLMPSFESLPKSINTISYLNAVNLRADPDFDNDIRILEKSISRYKVRHKYKEYKYLFITSLVIILILLFYGAYKYSGYANNNVTSNNPSSSDLTLLAKKIFYNQAGGDRKNLVKWERNDNFLSIGMKGFIWYPKNTTARFGNSALNYIDYIKKRGTTLPAWLSNLVEGGIPWKNRDSFINNDHYDVILKLQDYMYVNIDIEIEYIVQNLEIIKNKMVEATSPKKKKHVSDNFDLMLSTSEGKFAMIDYSDFKGIGLNRNGGYRGNNWGLLQVLEEMESPSSKSDSVGKFSDAAEKVLKKRVNHSAPVRNEKKWLSGWIRRIDTYRQPIENNP